MNDLAVPQIGVPLLVVVFGSGQTHPETGNLGGTLLAKTGFKAAVGAELQPAG